MAKNPPLNPRLFEVEIPPGAERAGQANITSRRRHEWDVAHEGRAVDGAVDRNALTMVITDDGPQRMADDGEPLPYRGSVWLQLAVRAMPTELGSLRTWLRSSTPEQLAGQVMALSSADAAIEALTGAEGARSPWAMLIASSLQQQPAFVEKRVTLGRVYWLGEVMHD